MNKHYHKYCTHLMHLIVFLSLTLFSTKVLPQENYFSFKNLSKTKLLSLLLLLLSFTQINAQCWQSVSAGNSTTSAIKNDGTLWVWGDRSVYVSPEINQTSPLQIGTSNDWKLTVSKNLMIASIKNDGTLWMMHNYDALPIQVGSDTNWKSVDIGNGWYVAIKIDGTLWTWGKNRYGEIGLGSNYVGEPTSPVQIGTDTNWKSVTAGQEHRVAIKTDGTLWTWGNNQFTQLGLGDVMSTSVRYYVPTQIGTAANWLAVSAGNNHTLGIKTDGNLWAWGDNFYGQLGLNDNTKRTIPTAVISLDTWKSISAGGDHTLAISTNGRLFSWGNNQYGQVGNNTTTHIYDTLQISTSTLWQTVSSGYQYSIATTSNGSVWLWGSNYNGQLGNGTTTDKLIPNQILCPSSLGLEKKTLDGNPFVIYPNPANEILYLQYETNHVIDKIIITDLSGKIVLEQKINAMQINVQNLQQGMYLLKVFSEGKSSTIKFMKN